MESSNDSLSSFELEAGATASSEDVAVELLAEEASVSPVMMFYDSAVMPLTGALVRKELEKSEQKSPISRDSDAEEGFHRLMAALDRARYWNMIFPKFTELCWRNTVEDESRNCLLSQYELCWHSTKAQRTFEKIIRHFVVIGELPQASINFQEPGVTSVVFNEKVQEFPLIKIWIILENGISTRHEERCSDFGFTDQFSITFHELQRPKKEFQRPRLLRPISIKGRFRHKFKSSVESDFTTHYWELPKGSVYTL